MRKLLWLVGAVVVIGVVALAGKSLASPEGKACSRMRDLCGGDWNAKAFADCTDSMEKMKKMSGDASFDRSVRCIDESKSCAAATGCMMGGVGVGAIGEFMKGFGSALSN